MRSLRLEAVDANKGYKHRRPGFYDADAVSDDTGTDNRIPEVVEGKATGRMVEDPSMTDQSGSDDADINVMIRRFGLMGTMPVNPRTPLTEGMIGAMDYRESLDQIREAKSAFDALPADVRKRFDNDPAKYLEFFEKPENMDEAIKLGLASKPSDPVESQELITLREIRDGFANSDAREPSGSSGQGARGDGKAAKGR